MSRQSEDARLWAQWKRTNRPQDMQALLSQLQPIINQQVTRWGGTLSRPTLDLQGKILATKAVKSYDPDKGAALATHVTNQLQKLSRTVYTHSRGARLPEHKAIGVTSFQVAEEALRSQFGRDPSTSELSDHLGWSQGRTQAFREASQRRELLTSGEFNPAAFPIADQEDPIVGFVYHDMAPKTQQLFENITGYGGAKVMGNQDLMKKFEMTQGQLSYQKRKMTQLFKNAMEQES
jgi:hypothetical protein